MPKSGSLYDEDMQISWKEAVPIYEYMDFCWLLSQTAGPEPRNIHKGLMPTKI